MKVKVMEVDIARKRIALSMRLGDEIERSAKPDQATRPSGRGKAQANNSRQGQRREKPQQQQQPQGAMAEAFARLKKG